MMEETMTMIHSSVLGRIDLGNKLESKKLMKARLKRLLEEILEEAGIKNMPVTVPDSVQHHRHQALVEWLAQRMRHFNWKIEDGRVTISAPKVNGEDASLLLLVLLELGWLEDAEDHLIHRTDVRGDYFHWLRPLLQIPEVGDDFCMLMRELDFAVPIPEVSTATANWLQNLVSTGSGTVHWTVCPDYPYVETGDPNRPYRYIFGGLNSGIGLVAKRAADLSIRLHQGFTAAGIPAPHFVLSGADFEFEDASLVRGTGLSREECIKRLRRSQQALGEYIAARCPDMKIHTPLFTEEMRVPKWKQAVASVGGLVVTPDELEEACGARANLIRAWRGEDADVEACVLSEGRGYATVARTVNARFNNVLICDATHRDMAPFMQMPGGERAAALFQRFTNY